MEIKYVRNKDIDIKRWNECIHSAYNGIIYAYSWYLDSICDDWNALISVNYDTVMPLPQKIISGKKYISRPLFGRQLGIFSTKIIDKKTIKCFIKSIPKEFKTVEIGFNKFNYIDEYPDQVFYQSTYELDLIYSYRRIFKNYSLDVRESLIEAYKNKVTIVSGLTPSDFINFIKSNKKYNNSLSTEEEYKSLRLLLTFCIRYKTGKVLAAYSSKNELCAIGFFVSSNNKIIFLFSAINQEGEKNRAVYLLIDYFIGSHVEKGFTLSFENIALENKPQIFEGFGAKKYEYPYFKKKTFVWYKNPFKKK